MEPLHRRSDDACETPSGQFAIIPLFVTGKKGENGEISTFTFKPDIFSEAIELQWPSDSPLIIVDQNIAITMVRNGHATGIPDELLARYEHAYADFLEKQAAEQAAAAKKPPVPPAPPAASLVAPPVPLTPVPPVDGKPAAPDTGANPAAFADGKKAK